MSEKQSTPTSLYDAANAACDAFQDACVKQFGARMASTKRYMIHQHNAETAAARESFLAAMNAYRASWKAEVL